MKLCAGAGAGTEGLGLLSLLAMCHTWLILPSKNCHQCHLRCHWVTKTSADTVLGNGSFCLSVQGTVAKQDPQRCLRGCWVLSSGDWSSFNFQSKAKLLCPVSIPWNCLYLSVWPRGPKPIPWCKQWLEFPCWGMDFAPGGLDGCLDFLGKPTRWSSCLRDQAPAGCCRSWENRPAFYWIVSVTGVSWASLASRALACNRKRSVLKMRKKEVCFHS